MTEIVLKLRLSDRATPFFEAAQAVLVTKKRNPADMPERLVSVFTEHQGDAQVVVVIVPSDEAVRWLAENISD